MNHSERKVLLANLKWIVWHPLSWAKWWFDWNIYDTYYRVGGWFPTRGKIRWY